MSLVILIVAIAAIVALVLLANGGGPKVTTIEHRHEDKDGDDA